MYINRFNDAIKSKYGRKMYKLSLDGGMTCPNRDGKVGTGGCIFCSGSGSGDFAEKFEGNINAQIERAKRRVENKAGDCGYIAYFQSYTNTYAPVEELKRLFWSVVENDDVDILSIATRPDCLEEDKIALLAELNRVKPVWVELGLQTVNEKTADYIRRGYRLPVYDDTVRRLKKENIDFIVHMIIGLPGETQEDMVKTARYISNSGAAGVKFQLLHVLEGTDLAKEYKMGKFNCLSLEKYTDILIECIRNTSHDVVIHRMTGDGAKKDLIAPIWSGNKKMVLNYINKALKDRDVNQGDLIRRNRQ